jgi:hypothetical protein
MVTSELIPDDQLKSLSPVLETSQAEPALRLENAEPFEFPALDQSRMQDEEPAPVVLMPREGLDFAQLEDDVPPRLVEPMEESRSGNDIAWNVALLAGSEPLTPGGDIDSFEEAPGAARLAGDGRPESTALRLSQPGEPFLLPPVEVPLADSKAVQAFDGEARTELQVHAPIEIHIHMEGRSGDSAEELREELLSVVPQAVHNAIEQLALQLGAV